MFHTRASSSGIALVFYLFFHLACCAVIPVPTYELTSFGQATATQAATSVLPTASGLQARIVERDATDDLTSILLLRGLIPLPSDNPIGDPFTISIKEPPGFPYPTTAVPSTSSTGDPFVKEPASPLSYPTIAVSSTSTGTFAVPGSAETAISGAQTTTTSAFVVPGQSLSASKASKANVFTAILVSILVGVTIFSVGS
ncbi:hypothetical protein K438DRAFT_550106 [Mycena galopus ATCC 62051]|nr:hypothetical protein K438DRAFT_550106 [Mycena galopus ATCC 62051]